VKRDDLIRALLNLPPDAEIVIKVHGKFGDDYEDVLIIDPLPDGRFLLY
jgi:hypothetical protein